jgi:hypothetical protein
MRRISHLLETPFAVAALPPWLWLGVLALAAAGALVTRQRPARAALALAVAAGAYAMAFAGYHGDALEVDRHLLLPRVLYRVVPLLALGALLSARRPRTDDGPTRCEGAPP